MGRRGNGEGSVRQRPDGRWESRVRLPGGERVSVYGVTRQEASEGAARILRDARLGVSVTDGRQSYGEYLAHWLELATPGLSEGTALAYESAIRLHIAPVIESVRLVDLTPYHIERVYARMLSEGLRSMNIVTNIMRASLSVAERRGLVARNVALLVDRPTEARPRYQAFTPDQSRQYLAICADPSISRIGPMLTVMLWTGLRLGEASALHWRDIELAARPGATDDDPALRVLYSMHHRSGDPVFNAPKTVFSKRRIVLARSAIDALRVWRQRQRADRVRAGAAWRTSFVAQRAGHQGEEISFADLVFTDEIGRPLHYSHVGHQHAKVCRASGLPRIRLHDLRHSFATLMLAAGVNPKIVAEMLGHTSVTITLDRYSHVLPDMQRDAVERLSRLIG